jgi:hypothetical protein
MHNDIAFIAPPRICPPRRSERDTFYYLDRLLEQKPGADIAVQ